MFDLGAPVPLSIEIRDSDDALADPGSIALTITKPDGTTDTPTPDHDGTGLYSYVYTPAAEGRYAVRWVATGANASAYTDAFNVRDQSTFLLSLAEAKAALNISPTDSSQDDELRDYIEAATSALEDRIGPVVARTVTSRVSGNGSLALPTCPVVSVTSLTGVYDGSPTVDASAVTVGPNSGLVSYLDGTSFCGYTYDVEYIAGRSGPVSPSIQQAARVLLQHLWRTQRGVGTRGRGDNGTDDYAAGFSIPNRVLELIRPFLKPPMVG